MTSLAMPSSMPLSVSFILSCLDRLKGAGIPEPQATVQAEIWQAVIQACEEGARKVSESTAREAVNAMRADLREELATKGDVRETELRLLKEIEVVRKEIQQAKHEMVRWYIGLTVALAGVFVGILAAFYAIMR